MQVCEHQAGLSQPDARSHGYISSRVNPAPSLWLKAGLDCLMRSKRGVKILFAYACLVGKGRYHVGTKNRLRTIQHHLEPVARNSLDPLFVRIFFLRPGGKSQSGENLFDAFAGERRALLTHTLPSMVGASGTSFLNRIRSVPNLMCRACMVKYR